MGCKAVKKELLNKPIILPVDDATDEHSKASYKRAVTLNILSELEVQDTIDNLNRSQSATKAIVNRAVTLNILSELEVEDGMQSQSSLEADRTIKPGKKEKITALPTASRET